MRVYLGPMKRHDIFILVKELNAPPDKKLNLNILSLWENEKYLMSANVFNDVETKILPVWIGLYIMWLWAINKNFFIVLFTFFFEILIREQNYKCVQIESICRQHYDGG